MTELPEVVVFDVNETLSDMSPLGQRFEDVGAPAHLLPTWFASVLRDGFALAVVGAQERFAVLASSVLTTVLAQAGVSDVEGGVQHVLAGLPELEVHADVPDGVRELRRAGLRLVTLTNGARENTEILLTRAGVREEFSDLLSVEQAGIWTPARQAYEHAVRTCGVPAERMLMVAVHPWDLDGAARAGLRTAWIDRNGTPYPAHSRPPDLTATSLTDLARQLTGS